MRMIDADALIDNMVDYVADGYADSRIDFESYTKMVQTAPTIDAVSEWIPCSERLPKPYTEVLVCDECGWISLGSYRPCDVTEKDSGWSTFTRIKLPTDEVLAWMPLPKPWKGADDE